MNTHQTDCIPSGRTRGSRFPTLLVVSLLGVTGGSLALATWGTWPDVLVDFGRELYIAWQLAEGQRLYADIAYYNGPLSPYLNALWFTLFGVSLHTLVWCNLAILAALTAILYHLANTLTDRFTATFVCLTFLCVFGFNQYVECGNYNYVCPYSHDAVHGLVLSLATFCLLRHAERTSHRRWLALGGLTTGLVFLTRSEVFTAACLGVAPYMLWVTSRGSFRERSIVNRSLFLLCALAPPAISIALLSARMPPTQAILGTLGAWPVLLSGKLSGMSFFRLSMGTDRFAENLTAMITWVGWTSLVVAIFWLIGRITRRTDGWVAASLFIIVFTLALLMGQVPWLIESARSLSFWTPVLCVGAAIRAWAQRLRSEDGSDAWLVLCLGLFSLGMLVKIILYARVYHYGFLHAMPAYLFCTGALVNEIPRRLDVLGRSGLVFRCAAVAMLAASAIGYLDIGQRKLVNKTTRVGAGADVFWSDPIRGQFVNLAIDRLQDKASPGETLVVLPEGVMINYLSRLKNPTPHTNFMPTEFEVFGEQAIIDSVVTHPPDWIILTHKDTSEFGVRFFGTDYARTIAQWVSEHYTIVDRIGEMPLVDDHYGILLLRRNQSSP